MSSHLGRCRHDAIVSLLGIHGRGGQLGLGRWLSSRARRFTLTSRAFGLGNLARRLRFSPAAAWALVFPSPRAFWLPSGTLGLLGRLWGNGRRFRLFAAAARSLDAAAALSHSGIPVSSGRFRLLGDFVLDLEIQSVVAGFEGEDKIGWLYE